MASEFRMLHRVEFADTDMAGILHFASFFRLMESTEHAFFRSLGLSVVMRDEEGRQLGWPRVHVECDFKAPLRFEDEVEVHLKVREKRTRTLVYDFDFWRVEGALRAEVARGSFVVACVHFDAASGRMRAVPIPGFVAERINSAEQSGEE